MRLRIISLSLVVSLISLFPQLAHAQVAASNPLEWVALAEGNEVINGQIEKQIKGQTQTALLQNTIAAEFNRIHQWEKQYNNTVTGEGRGGRLVYPEFKGYHANIYWAELQSETAPLTIYSEEDGLFLKVYNPEEAPDSPARVFPVLPEGDIALLLDIQAIKSFKPIHQQGPHSQPGNIRIKSGDEGLKIKVWFDFR